MKKLIYRWISKKFLDGCSNYNSLKVRKSCRSKKQARQVFSDNQVPHAKGKLFFSPWTAHKFAREYGFPLVIKPNVSGFSRGSYFPITNYIDLWKAAFKVKIWWPTSIVEQYLLGENYRVLVGNDEIISVIQRYPPFIIGNGKNTISELVDEENKIRESMSLYPTMHPISKNGLVISHLKRQGLTLNSIPTVDQKVTLFYRVALAPGGIVETVDIDTIPEKNQTLFLNVLKMFHANILGIDVIMEQGIETDYDQQKCIFLEVNSRPYIKMHNTPRYGDKPDLSAELAKLDELIIEQSDTF